MFWSNKKKKDWNHIQLNIWSSWKEKKKRLFREKLTDEDLLDEELKYKIKNIQERERK